MAIHIRRREFVITLGGAVVALPLAARGQQPAKLPTIGFLGASTPSAWNRWTPVFVQRLRELGWIEGRTVTIEYRWGKGFDEIAAEFVRLKVDVIFTNGTPPVLAAKQATSLIPIVFASPTDPVANGLVASLARPGGNVTGLSSQTADLAGKRLELLRSVVPGLRRLATFVVAGSANSALEMDEVQAAARTLSLEIAPFEIRRAEDIAPAFEALKGRGEALYVSFDLLTIVNRVRINTLASAGRVPTMFGTRDYVEAGGLMSYGPNIQDLWWRAAEYVDKILRGAKPADMPVEQPTKFELVINAQTARLLGVEVSPTLLAIADEVIE